jgi:hypothetical protein
MNLYPAMRYHATEKPVCVANPDEEAALGPGWYDDPDKIPAEPSIPPAAEDDPPPAEPAEESAPDKKGGKKGKGK